VPHQDIFALIIPAPVRLNGSFTPPDTVKTLSYPGTRGGSLWGGASYDPANNMLYINANDFGTTYSLRKVKVQAIDESDILARGRYFYHANCASCHGIPGGELVWQVPLGEYPELTEQGIPVTGTQNFGGSIVTAGGTRVGTPKGDAYVTFSLPN